MLSLIIWAAIGAAVGAGLGSLGKGIRSPLIATWRRGAGSGAITAALLFFVSGQARTETMNRSTDTVKRLGPDRFDAEVLHSSLPVMVDFYATWCGPCRTLAPRVEEVAQQFAGRIRVFKVNLDEASPLAERYHIGAIPTLLFFKNGALENRTLGVLSKDALETQINALLESRATVLK